MQIQSRANTDLLKDRGGARCLGVAIIPWLPVAPAVCSMSWSWKMEEPVVIPVNKKMDFQVLIVTITLQTLSVLYDHMIRFQHSWL